MSVNHSIQTILIIDDDPADSEKLRSCLLAEGYRILLAASASEGIAMARRELPDLVLMDVCMPHMDGFEACQHMRADRDLAEIPIILVTGLKDSASRLHGSESGAEAFISKPFDPVELRARARTITTLNRFRQLLTERQKVESLIQLSSDGIMVVTEHFEVVLVNPALMRMLGSDTETDFVGRQIWPILAPDEREEFKGFFRRFVDWERLSATMESRLLRLDGDTFDVEIAVNRVLWNHVPSIQLMIRDVTQRRRQEADINRIERLDSIARNTAQMAHDFNKYLDAIRLHAHILQRSGDSSGIAQVIVEIVDQAAIMTRQLLVFARKHRLPRLRALNMSRLLVQQVPILESLVPSADIHLVCSVREQSAWVMADEVQIRQMLMNLVINAADAIGTASGTITVSLERVEAQSEIRRARRTIGSGPYCLIEVSDTGEGLSKAAQEHIFEPFFSTKTKGTGLGLSEAYGTVRRSGGLIRVNSNSGLGTTVSILLPLAVHPQNQMMAAHPRPPVDGNPDDRHCKHHEVNR